MRQESFNRVILQSMLAFGMLFISGCHMLPLQLTIESSDKSAKTDVSVSVSAKDVAGKSVLVDYLRPNWIDIPPDDDAKNHYLVGLSNTFSSEKDARQDALKDARMSYAHYTGIDITEVSNMFSSIYSHSSNIFDPAFSGVERSVESVSVNIRRVKAKKWHVEKVKTRQNNNVIYAYRNWVLVEVPHDEYQRVQKWKEQQVARLNQKKRQKITGLKKDVIAAMKRHKRMLIETEHLVAMLNPLDALVALNNDWANLYNMQATLKKAKLDSNESFASQEGVLQKAQNKAVKMMANIRDKISIEVERSNANRFRRSSSNPSLMVKVTMTTADKIVPLHNIPLMLIDNQQVIDQSLSDNNGKAVFNYSNLEQKPYQVGVDFTSLGNQKLVKKLNKLFASNVQLVEFLSDNQIQDSASNVINISVTSKFGDNQTYIEGDTVSYLVSLDRDAYLLMIFEDAAGNLIQLIPNTNSPDNYLKARHYIEMPPVFAGYQFRISAPFGEESVYVYSSERPFPSLDGEFSVDGLLHVDKQRLKSIMGKFSDELKQSRIAYGEAKTVIQTSARFAALN